MPLVNSHAQTVSSLHLSNSSDNKKHSLMLVFLKRIFSIKNTVVKFSTTEIKSSKGDVIYKTKTGYVENYKNYLFKKSEDAIFIHGSHSQPGRIVYHEERLNAEELVDKIKEDYGLDIRQSNKKLHLVSCYSSSGNEKSFAQNISQCNWAYHQKL